MEQREEWRRRVDIMGCVCVYIIIYIGLGDYLQEREKEKDKPPYDQVRVCSRTKNASSQSFLGPLIPLGS